MKDTHDSHKDHFMYVLECADGTLYTGYTVDIEKRIQAHNSGCGAKYTRARRPVKLLASARFATKEEAMSAEFHFKQLDRSAKIELINCGRLFEDLLRSMFF